MERNGGPFDRPAVLGGMRLKNHVAAAILGAFVHMHTHAHRQATVISWEDAHVQDVPIHCMLMSSAGGGGGVFVYLCECQLAARSWLGSADGTW